MNAGPDWLTGGAYGIEGGAACTFALIISTLVVWRTKLVWKAMDENQSFEKENTSSKTAPGLRGFRTN
jgi:hypothetical protein